MLQSLFNEIVEALVSFASDAVIRFLGLENVVEFATAIVGLACIAGGFTIWWLG